VAVVRGIATLALRRRGSERPWRLRHPRDRWRVHAQPGVGWSGGCFGGCAPRCQARYARGIWGGWPHPVRALTGGQAVFFRVWRTGSGHRDDTTATATQASARRGQAQRPYPAGGVPHRLALTGASATPSSVWGVGAVERLWRARATAKPAVPQRGRTGSTVCTRHAYAAAIVPSDHAGPSASALRSRGARVTCSAVPLRRLTIA
jgi:hypothetical protein